MDVKKKYALDEKLVNEGTWIPTGEGSELLIAYMGNQKYQRMMNRLTRAYQVGKRGAIPDDVLEGFMLRAMAKHILLDWKSVEEGGKPLQYSEATAHHLLKTYRLFADMVVAFAQNQDNFKAEADEEVEKNS
jgi:hypothetical protein